MMLSAFGLPIREVTLDVLPTLELIPAGITVGVHINTHGVMVLGTGTVKGEDGNIYSPSEGKLQAGDLILTANGQSLTCKEDLAKVIANSDDLITLQIRRDDEVIEAMITPASTIAGNQIGSWVRDSTQGIGTITFINPETNTFGALGHGIMDVDTKKLMSVKSGEITASRITAVKKGNRGFPGELVGEIQTNEVIGQVKMNSPYGIYGTMEMPLPEEISQERLQIAKQDQIQIGEATVRSNVINNEVRDFVINIESVNLFSADETKGMIIRITDPDLISHTNGIVQGMSGSPIMQNGRIIGAITHVFVQDPTKGYGIFIENMIRQEQHLTR
jgi:stage IV sporulation protein B